MDKEDIKNTVEKYPPAKAFDSAITVREFAISIIAAYPEIKFEPAIRKMDRDKFYESIFKYECDRRTKAVGNILRNAGIHEVILGDDYRTYVGCKFIDDYATVTYDYCEIIVFSDRNVIRDSLAENDIEISDNGVLLCECFDFIQEVEFGVFESFKRRVELIDISDIPKSDPFEVNELIAAPIGFLVRI